MHTTQKIQKIKISDLLSIEYNQIDNEDLFVITDVEYDDFTGEQKLISRKLNMKTFKDFIAKSGEIIDSISTNLSVDQKINDSMNKLSTELSVDEKILSVDNKINDVSGDLTSEITSQINNLSLDNRLSNLSVDIVSSVAQSEEIINQISVTVKNTISNVIDLDEDIQVIDGGIATGLRPKI